MTGIPFDAINVAALRRAEQLVRSWCPGGKTHGNEYVPRNPTRDDNSAGSFSINLQTGVWKDFATDEAGADLISLYAYIHKVGQGDAARAVGNIVGIPVDDSPQGKPKGKPDVVPGRKPDWVWNWRRHDGKVIFQTHRWDMPDGSKVIRPAMRDPKDRKKLIPRLYPAPRPLFDVHLIGNEENIDSHVLVVEGEKTMDGARAGLERIKDHLFVTCWSGGANQAKNTDWETLRGRKVILLPDNDAPGRKTMLKLGQLLEGVAASVFILKPDMTGRPGKWDLADWTDADGDMVAWFKEACISHRFKPGDYEHTIAAKPPPDRGHLIRVDEEDLPFRCLGVSRTEKDRLTYHFISHHTGAFLSMHANAMNDAGLLQLAPPEYWRDLARAPDGRIRWKSARNTMMEICHAKGHVDVRKLRRGRGVWLSESDGRVCVHGGDEMFDGRRWVSPTYHNEFILERQPSLGIGSVQVADPDEMRGVLRAMQLLNWKEQWMPKFLLGWTLAAPFAGVMDWRSHCIISGASGAGKTTVTRELVSNKCLGNFLQSVVGRTTESGLRRQMGIEALPVRIDENEKETGSERAKEMGKEILQLCRVASSESGGAIVHGDGNIYNPRAMFIINWVDVALIEEADQNRFAVLELLPNRATDSQMHYERFLNAVHSIGDNYWRRAFWWTYTHRDEWVRATDILRDIYGRAKKSPRARDMLAPIYAIGLLATLGRVPDYEEAVRWIDNGEGDSGVDASSDDLDLLSFILNYVYVWQHDSDRMRREDLVRDLIRTIHDSGSYRTPEAAALRRFGIKLKMKDPNASNHSVCFATGGHLLNTALRPTRWRDSWRSTLARIPGAVKSKTPMAFANRNSSSRYIEIPLAACLEDEDDE